MEDIINVYDINTNNDNLNHENIIENINENKIEIFNDLYDIKEQIQDVIYIKLCNYIQSLIKENHKLQYQIKYRNSYENCYNLTHDEYVYSNDDEDTENDVTHEGIGPEEEITEL